MTMLNKWFCKLSLKPEKTELKPQSPWRKCEKIVQEKLPKYDKGSKVTIPLSNSDVVEPIIA